MKRCLAGLCLLLMLLTACTARPSQTPVTAKDDAARRAWLCLLYTSDAADD